MMPSPSNEVYLAPRTPRKMMPSTSNEVNLVRRKLRKMMPSTSNEGYLSVDSQDGR